MFVIRAVIELTAEGLVLKEIAPGTDLERDILAFMDFKLVIDPNLRLMPEAVFKKDFNLKLEQEPWQTEL